MSTDGNNEEQADLAPTENLEVEQTLDESTNDKDESEEKKPKDPKLKFLTQTEALLSVESKAEFQDVLKRSQPRKVCTILGNGVAVFCDKNCHHGQYNTRGECSDITDDDMFKFSPVISKRECVRYGTEYDHKSMVTGSTLPLNKLDGTPLNLMGTLVSDTNKVYRYSTSSLGVSCDFSCVRRDRPSCRFCKF